MSKLLVVFGATGQQGGSIIDYVLNDPQLSKEFTIRAVTRNPNPGLKVDFVQADAADPESLKAALKDAHTVFSLSVTIYDGKTYQTEYTHGKAIADAAVDEGAKYIIWSSLPSIKKISNGKYTRVEGFDSKADVEEYIRTLPIKSSFFHPGGFMQNLHTYTKPRRAGDHYDWYMGVNPQTQLPLIDIAGDTGKWIGAILAEPDKFEGKDIYAATRFYTLEEMLQIMRDVTGKDIRFVQLSIEDFAKALPPLMADQYSEMMLNHEEFGYYGAGGEEKVKWAADNARGKLSTLEEFLKRQPLNLD